MTKLIDITGKALSGEWGVDDDTGNGTPVIRTTNFTYTGKIDYTNVITRTINKKNIAKKFLCKGDIIIEKSGGSDKFPVGRVVFFDGEENKYLFNNFTGLLRVKDKEKWFPKYVLYSLLSNYNRGGTRKFENKTTGLHNLKIDDYVNKCNIRDVDFNHQKDICNQLDKIDNIICKYKEEQYLLDELVKARFVELFGDPATNEYNWPMLNLENVSSIITYGLTVRPTYVNKGIDLISARELHKGFIEYEVAPKISFNDFQSLSDKGKPLKNDILFSKTGSIGHCALVDTDKMFAITQNAARLGLIIEKVNPVWLLYYLRMNYIQDWCKRHAKGNAVKDLQLKDIKAIPLFECPLELQNQFAYFVKEVDKSRFIIKSMIKEGLL